MIRTIVGGLLALSVLAFALPTSASMIYWDSTINTADSWNRVDSAGGTPQTILSGSSTGPPGGIAIDPTGGYMYSGDPDHLFRTQLDGSGRVDLVSTGLNGGDVELDVVHGKVYWSTAWQGNPSDQFGLWRANLDGTNAEKIITIDSLTLSGGIAVDPIGGKVYYSIVASYWGEPHQSGIYSANLDGTGVSLFRDLQVSAYPNLQYETWPGDVELDVTSGKLYWTEVDYDENDLRPNRIRWVDLAGSGSGTLLSPAFDLGPRALAIDPLTGQIYFSDERPGVGAGDHLYRINADGTGFETVLQDPLAWISRVELAVPEPASLTLGFIGGVTVMVISYLRRRLGGQ